MRTEFKYTAFISYNSRDNSEARWLQSKLENYSMPSVIANEKGEILRSTDDVPKKFRIFRYVTDLVAQNLDDGLRHELDQSKFLIVVCSPNSAYAPWVRKEVRHFIETGRKKQIIPYVISGTPYSDAEDECYTPELKEAFPGGSLLGVHLMAPDDDLCIFRRRKAVAKIVSLLLDLPDAYDFIWDRYRFAYLKSLIVKVLLLVMAVVAVCVSISVVKHMEKPFDMMIRAVDLQADSQLPPVRDVEFSVTIDGDTYVSSIESLDSTAVFHPIPGRMKGSPMTLKVRSAYCMDLDTTLALREKIDIVLRRDPDRYGKIEILILKDMQPLINEDVMLEDVRCSTDEDGILRVFIPLDKQKESYVVSYGEYGGVVLMPCLGTDCINLMKL